jgi:hypothetical protein
MKKLRKNVKNVHDLIAADIAAGDPKAKGLPRGELEAARKSLGMSKLPSPPSSANATSRGATKNTKAHQMKTNEPPTPISVIKLTKLIELAGVPLGHFKIHCATGQGVNSPLEAFFTGTWKGWQERQTKRNFQCDKVLGLINLGGSKWLFAGIWKVNSCKERKTGSGTLYVYSTSEEPGLEHLTGKAVVHFEKKFRASYLVGHKYADQLDMVELRSKRMSTGDFPGYASVRLSFQKLTAIVNQNLPTWRAALKSVAGVYLRTV